MTQVMVGPYNVSLEQPKTSGSFLNTTKEWLEGAKGAYDFMNLVKKSALACGNTVLAATLTGYTSLTSTPYFLSLVAKHVNSGFEDLTPKLGFYNAMKWTHNVTEFCSMGLFSAAILDPMNKTIGNVAVVFDAVSDMSEVPTFLMDAVQARTVLNLAKELNVSDDVQGGLLSKLQHSLIKLVKSVSASVNGFFASYAVVYGAALVAASTALAFSLAATTCNVIDYFHQNCWSSHVAKEITLTA